ncbi:MAG: selenide, water dikinase SelD [Alsobacter sp.]
MRAAGPVSTDIVLVGGGHAHVQVMTRFAMAGHPGLRLTLVTEQLDTPYSGMLPGLVAGEYDRDEIHIDLARLAFATGTRLVHARALGLDRAARRVLLEGRPPLGYDLVSLNVGIVPDLSDMPGAETHAVPVKPIATFLSRFDALLERLRRPDGPRRFAVVGGGAAGVELALTLRRRLEREAAGQGLQAAALSVALVTSAPLVPGLNEGMRRKAREALRAARVETVEKARVVGVSAGALALDDGRSLPADAVLVSTKARAPAWLSELGLETTPDGALVVGPTLQAPGDPRVFAGGDCAAMLGRSLDKAGVYAVRAGPVLARNLALAARERAPKPWSPQRDFLVMLNAGDGTAIVGRGRHVAASGRWVRHWKDSIDRRFMRMFAEFGRQGPVAPDASGEIAPELRCAGCAAKVGAGPLGRALRRLPPPPATPFSGRVRGLGQPDDAAVIETGEGRLALETVDLITAFIGDPYRFGEIAALHALSDIHAMGGAPTHALATAILPAARPDVTAEDLFQLLSGARAALDREGVTLVGGHTGEGASLALGFTVNGEAEAGHLTRKEGLSPGDAVILTKPLGTGVVFAAAMRGAAPATSIAAALDSQRRSNREGARLLREHGARAVTDVTGFGLLGHLGEMAEASGVAVEVSRSGVPFLPGVERLVGEGFASSAVGQNVAAVEGLLAGRMSREAQALLLDPQTSGGLVAGVPPARADAAVAALRAAGFGHASRIGTVGAPGAAGPRLSVVD